MCVCVCVCVCVGGGGEGGHSNCNASLSQPNVQKNSSTPVPFLKFSKRTCVFTQFNYPKLQLEVNR